VAPGGGAPPATGPLAGLARSCLEETAGGRKALEEVVARHLRAHGRSPDRWLEDDVLPALEARGLGRRDRRRVLRFFHRTAWSRTAAGDATAAALEQRIGDLRRAVRSTTDPRDALALAAATGAAVLLIQDAWPLIEDLRRRAAEEGRSAGGGPGGPGGGDTGAGEADGPDAGGGEAAGPDAGGGEAAGPDAGGGEADGPDAGGLELDFDLPLDLPLDLGSVADAADAVGAGVDAGGGDGGGGDGGGGGGD